MSTERSAPKRSAPNFNLVSFFLPASGLHKEHKKVEDYFSTVSQKAKQKDHQAFLSSRKNWAKQHNKAGPDKKRLLSKKELVEAHKGLQIQHKTGGRFLAPKKQLVTAENWIEAKHGKWDPTKVVTEKVFGNSVQGVWLAKGEKCMILMNMTIQVSRSKRQCMIAPKHHFQKKASPANAKL
jgi:hypothetical protein